MTRGFFDLLSWSMRWLASDIDQHIMTVQASQVFEGGMAAGKVFRGGMETGQVFSGESTAQVEN